MAPRVDCLRQVVDQGKDRRRAAAWRAIVSPDWAATAWGGFGVARRRMRFVVTSAGAGGGGWVGLPLGGCGSAGVAGPDECRGWPGCRFRRRAGVGSWRIWWSSGVTLALRIGWPWRRMRAARASRVSACPSRCSSSPASRAAGSRAVLRGAQYSYGERLWRHRARRWRGRVRGVRWRRHRADERSGVSLTCNPARGRQVLTSTRCRYRASRPSRVARSAAGGRVQHQLPLVRTSRSRRQSGFRPVRVAD